MDIFFLDNFLFFLDTHFSFSTKVVTTYGYPFCGLTRHSYSGGHFVQFIGDGVSKEVVYD